MKTFERDGKINFVDINNVFVGFDYSQSCCESFGYFFGYKEPTKTNEFVGVIDTEDYNFDKSYFKQSIDNDDCGVVTFRLINKNNEEIFLTLYNSHNGYYGHGFDMSINDTVVHSGVI